MGGKSASSAYAINDGMVLQCGNSRLQVKSSSMLVTNKLAYIDQHLRRLQDIAIPGCYSLRLTDQWFPRRLQCCGLGGRSFLHCGWSRIVWCRAFIVLNKIILSSPASCPGDGALLHSSLSLSGCLWPNIYVSLVLYVCFFLVFVFL